MSYNKKTWDSTSYVTPSVMNNIENGIKALDDEVGSGGVVFSGDAEPTDLVPPVDADTFSGYSPSHYATKAQLDNVSSDLTNYATKTELNTKPTIISRDYTGNDISGFFSNFSTNLVTLTNGTYLISGVWASHDHYYGEFKKVDSFVWATIHIATYGVYMMEYKVGQYRYIYQLNTTRVE